MIGKYATTLRHLSPSSLDTYNLCPRKFFIEYILGIRGPSNYYAFKGSIVHRVLSAVISRYMANINVSYNDVLQIITSICNKYTLQNCELIQSVDVHEIKDLVMRVIDQNRYIGTIHGIEKRFHLAIDKKYDHAIIIPEKLISDFKKECYIIMGIIDLIKNTDSIHIMDWKTGKPKSKKQIEDGFQSQIYTIVGFLMFPNIDIINIDFDFIANLDRKKNIKTISLSYNQIDVQKSIRNVRLTCNAIYEDNYFKPHFNYLCNNYCVTQPNFCATISEMIKSGTNVNKMKLLLKNIIL